MRVLGQELRVCMYLCCVSENVSANYDRDCRVILPKKEIFLDIYV